MVLVALLGAVLVIAGCGSVPAEPAGPPNPFPPRPKNLDLSNVDLCATLTPAQKEERGIDRDRESAGVTEYGEPTSTCNWSNDENSAFYAIQIIQGSAAGALLKEGAGVSEISGFGAVRGPDENPARDPGYPPFCQIPIDASDTQTLRVQYESARGDASNPAEHEAACGVAIWLAQDILANLSR